jgi:plastocyanin
LIVAACGSSGSSTPDAPTVDAPPPTVRTVTCPPGDMPMVTTSNGVLAFDPMTTGISVAGIVKFAMSSEHNVGPDPGLPSDSGLRVPFGQTVCLEFDKAGTFHFICTLHVFKGTIIVQ